MQPDPKKAAARGLQFISFLVKNYSGAALNDLIQGGGPVAAVAQDLIYATQLLQGCSQGVKSDDEESIQEKDNEAETPGS